MYAQNTCGESSRSWKALETKRAAIKKDIEAASKKVDKVRRRPSWRASNPRQRLAFARLSA